MHKPSNRLADGLACRTSRLCKRDTCPECALLFHQATTEDGTVGIAASRDHYCDGYIELSEKDSSMFRDLAAPASQSAEKIIPPELPWYLGRQTQDERTTSKSGRLHYM